MKPIVGVEGRRVVRRLLPSLVFAAVVCAAPAFAYPGEQLLTFASNYIIAPLAIFAIVIAFTAGFFRQDVMKNGIYAAMLGAVLYFVISMAPQIMTAMKTA